MASNPSLSAQEAGQNEKAAAQQAGAPAQHQDSNLSGNSNKEHIPYHQRHYITDFVEHHGHHHANGQQHHGDGAPPRFFHLPRGIHEDGESGRKGLTPHFFRIVARSSCWPSALCNFLWPFSILALVFWKLDAFHDRVNIKFTMAYLGMIAPANLIGFAGQELARKLPKVFGVVLETFLGGIVEVILFVVLIVQSQDDLGIEGEGAHIDGHHSNIPTIQAAILGSVLANLLLCLGLCFVAGGVRHAAQTFSKEISETGSGLLLMAAFALSVPRAFGASLENAVQYTAQFKEDQILKISRAAGCILIIAYIIYIVFQMFSHHSIISEIFEIDEQQDRDREDDLAKDKLTLTECIVGLIIALGFVSLIAVILVEQIEPIISDSNNAVTDMFMGLILVPLVEKFAEHLTAIDEAWDNTMNLALSHVLGATLQTVLFNTGLIVVIGWGMGKPMSLDFNSFHIIIVVLAILAVSSFLRDGESTYLEGSICVLIYILIAVAAYYYPDVLEVEVEGFVNAENLTSLEYALHATETALSHATETPAAEAVHKAMRMMMRT